MSSPDTANRPKGTGVYSRCKHCKRDVFNHIKAYGRATVRMRYEGGRAHVAVCAPDIQWDEPPVYFCAGCDAQALRAEDLIEVYVAGHVRGVYRTYTWNGSKWVPVRQKAAS